jgi:histidinol-phosphate aminotransferase
MNIKPKKAVESLKAYDPGLFTGKYKLDANENSFEMPKGLQSRIMDKLKKLALNRYPDPSGVQLKATLGRKLGIRPETIVLGNGSDELLEYLMQSYIEPGDRIVVPAPTFEMYKIIGIINGAEVVESQLDKEFDLNEDDILKKAGDGRTKFIFIAYPNNPTGNCFSEEKIMRILENTAAFVVLDEAYYEFSGRTFIKKMKKYPNLIVMRTFSKAFSMAGLRIGYMTASQDVVDAVNKVRLPYNINSLSQFIASQALAESGEMEKNISTIKAQRDAMFCTLRELYPVVKSDANFLYIRFGSPIKAKKVFEKSGISIRMFSNGPAAGWSRITVGKPAENDAVLKILKRGV